MAGGGAGGSAQGGSGEACSDGAPSAHYIDSMGGDDNNDGSTPDAAWQSLERVNSEMFQPGDAICFRSGGNWTGEFALQGSGSSDAPIVVDQYGSGDTPRINAGPGDLQAILLRNVEYVEVNNLEVSNDQGGPGDYRGVSVRGSNAGELNHVHLRNLFVHDVTGEVNWIGGDTADNDPPWATFQTGWDRSKRTGGIVFETEAGSTTETWFNDIVVEDSVIQDTSFGGIIFKQLEALGGVRNSENDAGFRPHTNIVLRRNFLSQSNTEWGCNTIYLTGLQHALVEYNVTQDSGTSAIEAYNSDDVVIQHNETYGTVRKAGGADFNGIDADRATTNVFIQYNYVHDNGDGILLAQFSFGDSVIRYNVIANSSRMGINLHSDSRSTSQIYNNLFYGSAALTNTSGNGEHLDASYDIVNNIFLGAGGGASVRTGGNVVYSYNLFSGLSAEGSNAQTGDPGFANIGTWPSGDASGPALDALSGLTLVAGSPAVDNGTMVADNGGVDFFGNALYNGAPDIGPHELQ